MHVSGDNHEGSALTPCPEEWDRHFASDFAAMCIPDTTLSVRRISQQCGTQNKQMFLDVQVFTALESDNELMHGIRK